LFLYIIPFPQITKVCPHKLSGCPHTVKHFHCIKVENNKVNTPVAKVYL